MKPRLGTLFLFLGLFTAVSANRAWACGDADTEHVAKFHHEHDSTTHQHESGEFSNHCGDATNQCGENHPGKPCSDDEGGHCHCPGCGTACHAPAAFAATDTKNSFPFLFGASVQRQAFYFAEHLPEAVYLPIWQPPKLMV